MSPQLRAKVDGVADDELQLMETMNQYNAALLYLLR